jgi:hypothetical protein
MFASVKGLNDSRPTATRIFVKQRNGSGRSPARITFSDAKLLPAKLYVRRSDIATGALLTPRQWSWAAGPVC